jgi:hypothetical protein
LACLERTVAHRMMAEGEELDSNILSQNCE